MTEQNGDSQKMKCQGKTEDGQDCGHILPSDAKFCLQCGTNVEKKTDTLTCSHCGAALVPETKFCGECGKKVDSGQSYVQQKTCAGKLEDGSPCEYKLLSTLSFCPNCGTKISKLDSSLSSSNTNSSVELKTDNKNTDVKNSARQTDTGSQAKDNPVCEKTGGTVPVKTNYDNVTSVKQLYGKGEDEETCQKLPVDVKTGDDKACAGKDARPETVPTLAVSTDDPGKQTSVPVPCTDDTKPPRASDLSGEKSCTHTQKQVDQESNGDQAAPVPESAKDGSGAESAVSDGAKEPARTFFSQYADRSFLEKEIDFSDKQTPNNISPLSNKDAEAEELQEKLSVKNKGGNDSAMDDSGLGGSDSSHSMISREETDKLSTSTAENQTGEAHIDESQKDLSSSGQYENTGSGQDDLKDPPSSAVHDKDVGQGPQEDPDKKEEVSKGSAKKEQMTERKSREEKKKGNKSGKKGEQSQQKHEKEKKNDANKTVDKGERAENVMESPVDVVQTDNGAQPGKSTQQNGKTYAQAASGPGKQPSKGKPMQNSAGRTSLMNNAENVTVVFHVIVSNMWEEMNTEKYQIFLRCKPDRLGGFVPTEDKNRMSYIGKHDTGFLYEGRLTMERHLRNSGFMYKYIAKKVKNDKTKVVWEIVQRKEGAENQHLVNRRFFVPDRKKAFTGVWHRYDGVAYFPEALSEGVFSRIFTGLTGRGGFINKYRHDAVASAKTFLPPAEDICKASLMPASNGQKTMEGFLLEIDQVMSSLRYHMLQHNMHFVDDNLEKEAIVDAVVRPLTRKLEETQHNVTLGLFLLLLIEKFAIAVDTNFVQFMCRSLLIRPDMNNTTCADLETIASHFPANMADKSGFAATVCKLIDQSDQEGWWQFCSDSSWLFCVPLVHFLQGKSQPYQDPEPSSRFRKDEWWGLTDITRRKSSYMESTKMMRLPDAVIEQFKPTFQLDPLFTRTFVASLELEPLLPVLISGIIPVDIMAATLAHHVQTNVVLFKEHKQKIEVCVNKMVTMSREAAQKQSSLQDLKTVSCTAQIIKDLHQQLLTSYRLQVSDDTILIGTYLVFLALDHVALTEEKQCKKNGGVQAQRWQQDAKETTEAICNWLSSGFGYHHSRLKTLKMWDTLLAKIEEGLSDADLKKTVKTLLAEGFEKELGKLSPDQKLAVYLVQYKVAPAFADILNRLAFDSLDAAFAMESHHVAGESVHLISLLQTFIEEKWRENVKEEKDVLQFVITWIPMVNYFKRFGEKTNAQPMSKLAAKNITSALSCVQRLLDDLKEGSIQTKTLQLLMSNRDRFLALMDAAGHDKASVTALLDLRNHEMQSYISTSTQVDGLLEYCKQDLRTEDLPEVLRGAEELRDSAHTLPLSAICDVALPDSIQDLTTYQPKANPWKLSEDICSILPEFGGRLASYIFRKLFSDTAQRTDWSTVKFWRAFQIVYSEVGKEWQTLCHKMIDGTITLAETQRVFSMFRSSGGSYRYDEISQELRKLGSGDGGRWVDERIKQFSCFTTIKEYVKAAMVLLKVKKAFDIKGNFGDIEQICSLSQDKSLPIQKVDHSVLRLCTLLKDVTPQGIDCLKKFVDPRCIEFVSWLKENMQDGMKELHVFVDLAFISAGEEPWAIGRVECFHAATIGYAPLIFMEKDKGCDHMLQQCKLVFANVTADASLPEKLVDTSRYLDWFKDVQRSHGSVEKTSLSQVGNINARGVFRVGKGTKPGMTLPSVIQLKVSEDEDVKNLSSKDRKEATPPRRYSYEELLDLQSRLMLVAGQAEKGKENVDRFITIMESLVRLGKTYVQLCSDGCVLFLDWTVEFLCDVERPVCCVSEFANQGKLKGHRSQHHDSASKSEDLEDFIAGMAGFLENCHCEWLQYVDQKRRDYPGLNVYTVEQLVFLQQELVKVGSADVSKYVYPMLSLLKIDCSSQDLEQALQEAMDHVDFLERQHHHSHQKQQQQKQTQPVGDKEKVESFLNEMIDSGFSKALALKAMEEVGPDDIAQGIAWCMNHEDDMDDLGDDLHQSDEEEEVPREEASGTKMVGQRLKEWVTRTETITQSAVGWLENVDKRERGTTLKSLKNNLTSVWRKFLETVSFSGMDFLSLEHLGIVLKCLALKDERQFERSLPPNFKAKIPNLILCPKNEVLNAVTYMYMFPEDKDALLPQPDEVLLCTEDTTFEQVDIFLRRTFFGTQQKVHCLAFADTLDYDVGEKAEKKIKEYVSMAGDEDYHLVVVCTAENEYRARIVAALEKFRRPSPALSNTNMVCNYLRARFAGRLSKAGMQSASVHDPDSLCVRVVKSNRSGVGKTLYKQRLTTQLKQSLLRERRPLSITIPFHGRVAHIEDIAACLLQNTLDPGVVLPRIVHLDISYQVQEGVDHLLYNLLVLGCVTDSHGQVWLRSPMDLYLVETMPLLDQKDPQRGGALVHQIFDVLPSLNCWSPLDSLSIMKNPKAVPGYQRHDCLFDEQEFRSDMYQRPYRYLHELGTQGKPPQPGPQGDAVVQKADCLETLLRYCGVVNPSWSELTHFVCFLNKQLQDFEKSVYCSMATSQDLPGFSLFVLRFLIQMSRDFATRSLKMSEESLAALMPDDNNDTDIQQYELRRTWESSPHPYIFFNPDGHSMTFLGFSIDGASGNLVDQQTGRVLDQAIMNRQLYQALIVNRVPLTENFDALPREDRLLRLYRVLGLFDEEVFDDNNQIIDPDDTYELTTDNVKKILAIYMRFRCNIPVIVMGETGCGKTRLVKFLCALQTPRRKDINTMVLVKVHGGTTGEDIIKKVRQAEKKAKKNAAAVGHRPVYTVLFFDEANTTEAVGVIKEVMCDGTLDGQQMNLTQSLKMVAACNPYRKHSDDLIERLENAGLGYHVDADKTVDKLGRVPMRRLVYRVQPLPQSMLPLVWDFGQLNTRVEELYIRQMVRRYVRNNQLDYLDEAGMNVLCRILMESQEFMRHLSDECSFVSLRDVDRALTVASWFLQQAQDSGTLFYLLDQKFQRPEEEEEEAFESADSDILEEEEEADQDMSNMTKALVLSLGVCYRACLRSKEDYDQHIIRYFQAPFTLPNEVHQFALVINRCQDVFLDSVRLEDNIARNQALKENVFMMVVCIELRIPLFLVGKPGSSKSLAKTIVSDAMQGNSAYSELFQTLKQAQMVSFQCSPLATADGILGTFRQCAQFQKGKNKDNFVSVVVLDEVGLAEDSPKMPLKTLHPLLEDGCPGDEVPDDSKKVAFIGISNWALDPAKMNRGILVQRDVPDEEELIETARGICTTRDELALANVSLLIPELAKAYLLIFKQAKRKREFFGLRDFYSLVKMVYSFAARSKKCPSQRQLIAAIRRNFGGLDTIDPLESFRKLLPTSLSEEKRRPGDPDCSAAGLIKAALSGDDMGGESRYLLLLTENYGGLSILSENLLADRHVVPIFGSSFPKDQEYTQICRNINRIKVCMETGQTVILLNLENLYESLYDALNQYYATLGGERYVDLGLGTHRVKCRVHRQFRLIVVAEKQVVYEKFPIPLINRLEKHFLTLNNIMSKAQLDLAKRLEKWAQEFVSTAPAGPMTRARARGAKKEEAVGDVFMGYHSDTAPAIILKVWDTLKVAQNPSAAKHQDKVMAECQRMLLWCATPDAVVRSQYIQWSEVYHQEQQHEHLQQYLQHRLQQHSSDSAMIMAQVTTHSKLLTEQERQTLCQCLPVSAVTLLSLQAFDTEQQFCQQLRLFFSDSREGNKLLLVQCDSGDVNQNLIKCAQYCMQDLRPADSTQHHVVFIIQLPRIAGACFTGFLGGNWHCLHIDDLRATDGPVPSITLLQSHTPAQLIMASTQTSQEQLSDNTNNNSPDDPMQWEEGEGAVGGMEPEQMDVDVEDVQLELHPTASTADRNWDVPQSQGFDPQYIRRLFTSSIQAAVALVRDAQEGTARATRRITILLHLMEENAGFFTGLHKLVGSILEERERRAIEAERWLSREAAKLDSVKKAGTFRRAWMQYMENKVVPVLAGAIAYLDTNNNLDLLYTLGTEIQDLSTPGWVQQLWLGVLQGVCQLSYKHLRSMSDKEELEEFTVHHTGAGAVPFSAQLPFSWLVWELVDSTISEAKAADGDLLDTAGNVVEQSPLGKCLQKAVADCEDNLQQMFKLYISDLLYFTFPHLPQEHELLCACLEKGLQQLHINLVQLEVGRGLVALHMLVEQMRPRLQAILDMAGSRPNAVQALRAGAAGPCAELLNAPDEMTEDIAVLRLLVEELQPRPSQLDEEIGSMEWVAQYGAVAPVILRILSESDALLAPSCWAENPEGEAEEGEEEETEVATVLPYGEKCKQQLKMIRCLWTRVTTLKLFFDYVGPLRQEPEKLRKALGHVKFKVLTLLLDNDTNMKEVRSLKQVDMFLKRSNGAMIKELLGRVGKCAYCDKKFESAPVELPCKHPLCNSCYRDRCHGNTVDAQCPECEARVPRNFDPSTAKCRDRDAVELLGRYQRQVSGFLMALVSQLCFAGKDAPEPEAVRHIFGYIIHRSKGRELLQTKHMTVHDDLIDPTPVLRSFLLRLLLKHSEKEVYRYLEEFLGNAQLMADQEMAASAQPAKTPTLLEFRLLIIHCLEDLHHEQDALVSADLNREERLLSLATKLNNLTDTLRAQPMGLTSLYSLGQLRYTLDACAHILYNTFVNSRGSPVITEDMENLLFELQRICQNDTTDWPKKFLIRQLCREYGIQAFLSLAKLAKQQNVLDWITIKEPQNKVKEVADRYLVCTNYYKAVRDELAQFKLHGDSKDLMQLMQTLRISAEQKEMLLLLALHREVTMSILHPMPEQGRADMGKNMQKLVQECDILQDKTLARQLCDNQLGEAGSALCLQQDQDLGVQSLVCVLTHLRLALRPGAKGSHLLNPLCALVFQPANMTNAFLPTMPEDNLQEVLAVIKEKVWQCPRGHRYLIGDCGRPYQEGMCPCGQRIGGAGHIPAAQNIENAGVDQTQTGHILGAAAQRGLESVPERQLSAVESALLRFLTHAAFYLGASNSAQVAVVSQMVVPRIAPGQAAQFFWDHLQRDVQVLQRVLGRSADDIYLVLHHICHQLAGNQAGGNQVPVYLRSKDERKQWERHFTAVFIAPAVRNLDTIVQTGNRAIVSDTRQGESALLKLVYEDENQMAPDQNVHQLHTNPSVWRYRPRITVDHFFRQFHLQVEADKKKKGGYPVIRLFKGERHIIHALHYVPAILTGQKRLMMQLHKRLDRAEAATLTVHDVMKRNERAGALRQLLDNFSKAWEIVKEHLIGFQCVAPMKGLVTLPEEFHNASITRASPVAVLLPSTSGPGLCSYILLQFLIGKNNDFLETYCPLVNQSYDKLPEVSVRAVTERHLVGSSPERDLLPMVLAHSNYSLMVGQAATLDYDFAAFQQQLQDTLLQCKARVQRLPLGHIPVETMVYRADTTSSRLFKVLREKIEQECLSPAERRQIIEDLRDLPDICQSIDNLNTALSFLKALGGVPSASLHDFMSTALKMKRTVFSRKAQQLCCLTHVQSLWILLCYRRACILAAHRQDAFDSVEKELRDQLTPEQGKELESACQRMSIERLELLLLQLFECIMLHLSEPRDQDDDTRPENFKLRDVLMTNLEAPLYHTEPVEVRSGLLTADDLSSFPESLQGRHATVTWVLCHFHLANKRQQFL